MKKYPSVAVAMASFAMAVATMPAAAQVGEDNAPQQYGWQQSGRQLYLYAPGETGRGTVDQLNAPQLTPYPNPITHSGSEENRSEWDPGYAPHAPQD